MGKIFGKFSKSKVSNEDVMDGSSRNNGLPTRFGEMKDTFNVPFKSGTKAAVGPTDGNEYKITTAGGSSGDGPTPGFTGSGTGVDTLN